MSNETETPETTQLEQTADATEATATEAPASESTPTEAPATFDADYVKGLRAEAAEYRVKAKRAEALAAQALRAMATADGRLIDPSDLHYDESLMAKDGTIDPDKVAEAISELGRTKPHLIRQRPTTPVAQGPRASATEPNLLQLIKGA